MKKIIIGVVIAVAVLAIIGSVLVFGNFFKPDPKTAVTEAVTKTFDEFKSADENETNPSDALKDFKQVKADVTLGINELSGDAFASADPSILAALKMFTVKETIRYNIAEQKREDRLALQLAVTPLAEIITYADANQVALSVPVAFDYFVTADPTHFSTDWNNSILGTLLGTLIDGEMEQTIYDGYMSAWLPEKNESEVSIDFDEYLQILIENAEYLYIDEETISDGGWEIVCDAYDVTVPAENFEALVEMLVTDLKRINGLANSVTAEQFAQMESYFGSLDFDDETIRVYIADKKIRGFELDGDFNAEVYFKGEEINLEEIHAEIGTEIGDFVLDTTTNLDGIFSSEGELNVTPSEPDASEALLSWDIQYDEGEAEDNLEFSFTGEMDGNSVAVSGTGSYKYTEELFDLQLDSLAVTSNIPGSELDLDVSLGVTVTEDTEPIELSSETKALTDITEMDLMAMYEKIISNEEFGALLQQFQ